MARTKRVQYGYDRVCRIVAELPRRQVQFYTPNSSGRLPASASNDIIDGLAYSRKNRFSLSDIIREGWHLGADVFSYRLMLPPERVQAIWVQESQRAEQRLGMIANTLHAMGDNRLPDDPTGIVTWSALAGEVQYASVMRRDGHPYVYHTASTAFLYDLGSREIDESPRRRAAGRALAYGHDGFEDISAHGASFVNQPRLTTTPELLRRGFEICGHPYDRLAVNALIAITKNTDPYGDKITSGRYNWRTDRNSLSRGVKVADRYHNLHNEPPLKSAEDRTRRDKTKQEYGSALARTAKRWVEGERFCKVIAEAAQDEARLAAHFEQHQQIMSADSVRRLIDQWEATAW